MRLRLNCRLMSTKIVSTSSTGSSKRKKGRYSSSWQPHLRAMGRHFHMGSHSVTCHPTQVSVLHLTPAMQAGTRFTYPREMEGWVDPVDLIAPRPGVEPETFWSRVRRRTVAPPRQPLFISDEATITDYTLAELMWNTDSLFGRQTVSVSCGCPRQIRHIWSGFRGHRKTSYCMWNICRGEPWNLGNWPTEFGKICRGKLWSLTNWEQLG